ncbi:uncharacterized protein LOC144987864 isoform X2 [Oryzias latipes]
MSSEPQEGSVREQLSAAEGTSVQNEEELCRQRRLLDNDMSWNPQIQLHHIVLPQYWMTEEEDLCNQQRTFRVEEDEPVPPQIKEEPGELSISQDEDQLDLKQETDTLMEIPTYEENENSEADLNNQQSFDVTKSQDEEGNQHEESTSTTDEETDPLNRNQRKRRDRRHVQSVESSHMSEGLPFLHESNPSLHPSRAEDEILYAPQNLQPRHRQELQPRHRQELQPRHRQELLFRFRETHVLTPGRRLLVKLHATSPSWFRRPFQNKSRLLTFHPPLPSGLQHLGLPSSDHDKSAFFENSG